MFPEHLYGIIGHPLGHSLSPALHNWSFDRLGHGGAFFAWPLPPESVGSFVQAFRLLNMDGACVTIPHKEAVLPLLDTVSARARRMGAVNTLYRKDGALCGENTDVDGFMAPLKTRQVAASALVLGAGGAARAVVAGLQELGVAHIAITNHSPAKAEALAAHFGIRALPWESRAQLGAAWVINTTPLGMQGAHAAETAFPAAGFCGQGLAYDLVYNPLHTRFLREAQAAGWETQDGLDMFVGQALFQQQLWTGQAVDFAEARAFLEESLHLAQAAPHA